MPHENTQPALCCLHPDRCHEDLHD
jgi:hypothetical protein